MKFLKPTVILIFITLLLPKCSKEKDTQSPDKKGEFIIEGISYPIEKGSVRMHYEDPKGVYWYWVVLSSAEISVAGENDIAGKGNLIDMVLFTQSAGGLEPGEYIIDPESQSPGYTTLKGYIDLDRAEDKIAHYYVFLSGNLEIKMEGEDFVISIHARGEERTLDDQVLKKAIEMSGYYRGGL